MGTCHFQAALSLNLTSINAMAFTLRQMFSMVESLLIGFAIFLGLFLLRLQVISPI